MKAILLGPPGVGKGTYASRIAPKLGIPHISTGDIFRAEMKAGTKLGNRAKEYIGKGQLVPDEITIGMLLNRLKGPDASNGFILDGFPRTIAQAEALGESVEIDVVINLVLRDEILVKKISARRLCRNCGEIYNIAHIREGKINMPPVLPKKEGACDKCGGPLYQRDDDREATVMDRLKVYKEQTAPLIDYYRDSGLLKDVNVIGGPDVMVPLVMKAMGASG